MLLLTGSERKRETKAVVRKTSLLFSESVWERSVLSPLPSIEGRQ